MPLELRSDPDPLRACGGHAPQGRPRPRTPRSRCTTAAAGVADLPPTSDVALRRRRVAERPDSDAAMPLDEPLYPINLRGSPATDAWWSAQVPSQPRRSAACSIASGGGGGRPGRLLRRRRPAQRSRSSGGGIDPTTWSACGSSSPRPATESSRRASPRRAAPLGAGRRRQRSRQLRFHAAEPGSTWSGAADRVHPGAQPCARDLAPHADWRRVRIRDRGPLRPVRRGPRSDRRSGTFVRRSGLAGSPRLGDAGFVREGRLVGKQGAPAGVSVVVIGVNNRTMPLDLFERLTDGAPGACPRRCATSRRASTSARCGALHVQPHRGLRLRREVPRRLRRRPQLPGRTGLRRT